jgi:hypothetical protein
MDSISQTLLKPVLKSVQEWMVTHPVIAWAMNHPLWAIALFFIVLLLCWGLLGAIARLVQQAWLMILQAPLKLLRWLFTGLFNAFFIRRLKADGRALKAEEPLVFEQREQRLLETLNRLEALQQEQEELMQEVKTILMLKS